MGGAWLARVYVKDRGPAQAIVKPPPFVAQDNSDETEHEWNGREPEAKQSPYGMPGA